MNTQRSLVLYNEDKYWNPELKREFFNRVMHLWTKDYIGYSRVETLEEMQNQPLPEDKTSIPDR
jgi:hypothetical protein